jgi:hypothetical protein
MPTFLTLFIAIYVFIIAAKWVLKIVKSFTLKMYEVREYG